MKHSILSFNGDHLNSFIVPKTIIAAKIIYGDRSFQFD